MKSLFVLAISFMSLSHLQAQVNFIDPKIIIVSCKSGTLYIDGNLIGPIEADDAYQHILSIGEHYLQLRTNNDKKSLTIKVEQNLNPIIKIGCENTSAPSTTNLAAQQPPLNSVTKTLLFDKQLNLTGSLGKEIEQNAVALDAGDEIVINCAVLNKKGAASIYIREYTRGNEIYRKESFNSLRDQHISIQARGIYIVNVTTNALFGKDVKLMVERIASQSGNTSFKTTVRKYYDTTSVEVLNTTAHVYSQMNSNSNKTPVKIPLPANTTYWTYWLGVGQESQQQMKKFAANLSSGAKLISANPLVLFGLSVIPNLPMLNAKSSVSYRFMDNQNSQLFAHGQPSRCYDFKFADNVSTDYSIIYKAPSEIVLNLWNNSSISGQDVEVRVVAFIVKVKLAMEE